MTNQHLLVKDKATDYIILLPNIPSKSEQYAARLMQNIFELMGVSITISQEKSSKDSKYISIGNTCIGQELIKNYNIEKLGTDGFVVKTENGNVILNAFGEWGKIYAVLEFAEKNLDYMYYAKDEIRITKEPVVALKSMDFTSAPDFIGRDVFNYDTHSDAEHSVQLRLNGYYVKWQDCHGEGTPWSSLNDQSLVLQIIPHNQYIAKHPDWYYIPYDNGSNSLKTQICFTKGFYDDTKGGMLETFVDNLINNYIIPEKDKKLFMLGITDNEHFCNCEQCTKDVAKYSKSGVMMRFINKVADLVEQWRVKNAPIREIFIVTFAYAAVFESPVKKDGDKYIPIDESVVAKNNVIVRFAPISANNAKSLIDPIYNYQSRDSILGWKAITKRFAVWDYRVDFHSYFAPYPQWQSIKENILLYKNIGVLDVFNQGCRPTSGTPFCHLDNFVRSRMLWDTTRELKDLTDEFINVYYKNVAQHIKKYIEFLNAHYNRIYKEQDYRARCHENLFNANFWPYEDIIKIKEIFDKAYADLNTINIDEAKRIKLKKRLDGESIFYRFMLIGLYSDWFENKNDLNTAIDELESAAASVNFTVVKSAIPFIRDLKIKDVITYWREQQKNK